MSSGPCLSMQCVGCYETFQTMIPFSWHSLPGVTRHDTAFFREQTGLLSCLVLFGVWVACANVEHLRAVEI